VAVVPSVLLNPQYVAASLRPAISYLIYLRQYPPVRLSARRSISDGQISNLREHTHARTHTHPFNGRLSGTTQVSRYQKGKTNLDFIEARDSEWQWHQLGHTQVCNSLQTDNHASTPPLCFLQAGCPSCRPTNSVKALKSRTAI